MRNIIVNSKGEERIADIVSTLGNIDFIKDDNIYKGIPVKVVFVNSESDLSALTSYEPGTVAFTAGFTSIWQKGLDGTWVAISQE